MSQRLAVAVLVTCATVGACARPMIPPARQGTADLRLIDEPCNAANSTLEGPTRTMRFDPVEFPVPSRWVPEFKTLNDLDFNLQKTGATLHVWKGAKFVFNPVLPLNSAQCELTRGDTTIRIVTTMFVTGITSYRVDVTWSPEIEGQHLYMQLSTRFPEHLKQVRGVIDGVTMIPRDAAAKP
jgi:hypothetical protein